MRKLLVLFFLFSVSVTAQPAFDVTHWMTDGVGTVNPLGSPRFHVVTTDSGTVWYFDYQVRNRVALSYNLDSSTTPVDRYNFDDNGYIGDYHFHMYPNRFDTDIGNDSVWMAMGIGGSPGAVHYWVTNVQSDQITTLVHDSTILENFDANIVVGAFAPVPNSAGAMLAGRRSGGSTSNNITWYSSDRGATINAADTFRVTASTVDSRFGFAFNSTNFYYLLDSNAAGLTNVYRWDGTGTGWTPDGTAIFNAGNRSISWGFFGNPYTNADTFMFIAAHNDPYGDSIYFYSAFKHIDSPATAWNVIDSTYISLGMNTGSTPSMMGTTLHFGYNTNVMYATCGYFKNDVASLDSAGIQLLSFDWTDTSWTLLGKVDTGYGHVDNSYMHSGSFYVDSTWGSKTADSAFDNFFVLYEGDTGSGADTWLTMITVRGLLPVLTQDIPQIIMVQ